MQLLSRLGDRNPPCSPISHCSDALLLVCYDKNGGLPRELPATGKTVVFHQSRGGFPSVLIATSLAISKKSTFPSLCKQQQKTVCLTLFQTDLSQLFGSEKQSGSKGPFQTSISCNLQRCIIDSAQDKPANPFFKKSAKAYSMLFSTFTCQQRFPLFRIAHITLKYTVLLGQNDLNHHPTLQTLPSYGRKPTLFGLVVSDFPEAWQSVSTISRSKLTCHKLSPTRPKTTQTCRVYLCHLQTILFEQKWWGFGRATLGPLSLPTCYHSLFKS